jgi:hypothetical protein
VLRRAPQMSLILCYGGQLRITLTRSARHFRQARVLRPVFFAEAGRPASAKPEHIPKESPEVLLGWDTLLRHDKVKPFARQF